LCEQKPEHLKDHIVPGWNDTVAEKHALARTALHEWCLRGKPKFGLVFSDMCRTRAQFKSAFRYCKQHEDQLKADKCVQCLDFGDAKGFWNNVHNMSNSKINNSATAINGVTGEQSIADLWKTHFENVYNSMNDDTARQSLFDNMGDKSCSPVVVTVVM
jgi:hypothetical protein